MHKTDTILVLPSWYPSRVDKFNGDFIQRHVQAIEIFKKQYLIYVIKDKESVGRTEITINSTERLTEKIIYYRPLVTGIGFVDRILSHRMYLRLANEAIDDFIATEGIPQLVHVHVAMKAGLLARLLKKKYNIPYIITEHWTGYFKGADRNIYNSGYFLKRLTKKVLTNARLLLPVSKNLGATINGFVKRPNIVIPNVVDTNQFYFDPQPKNKFRFIHVSTMGIHKNPEGIIRVAKLLWDEGFEFELMMIGSINSEVINLANSYELSDSQIMFKSECPYSTIASEMKQASAFILFSTVENLPCVILEALCSGLPVISSDVGGIKEVIDESNGILVESKNEGQLKNAMEKMIKGYGIYNRKSIAEMASARFNYNVVAKQIVDVYEGISKQI